MMNIVVDNREKKPYRFPNYENVIRKRLNVGDYTIEGFEDIFSVERKSLDDLATSVGHDRERFENEIIRAQGLEDFVVVIEADRDDVERYVGSKRAPTYYSKIYPASIIGTVDKWPAKYNTLDFEWCGSREFARERTLQLLSQWVNYHD